jgi:hypothetical protein
MSAKQGTVTTHILKMDDADSCDSKCHDHHLHCWKSVQAASSHDNEHLHQQNFGAGYSVWASQDTAGERVQIAHAGGLQQHKHNKGWAEQDVSSTWLQGQQILVPTVAVLHSCTILHTVQ